MTLHMAAVAEALIDQLGGPEGSALSSPGSGGVPLYRYAPRQPRYPYGYVLLHSATPDDTIDTPASRHVLQLAIVASLRGGADALDMGATLDMAHDALHRAALTVDGAHSVSCEVAACEAGHSEDGETYVGNITLNIRID